MLRTLSYRPPENMADWFRFLGGYVDALLNSLWNSGDLCSMTQEGVYTRFLREYSDIAASLDAEGRAVLAQIIAARYSIAIEHCEVTDAGEETVVSPNGDIMPPYPWPTEPLPGEPPPVGPPSPPPLPPTGEEAERYALVRSAADVIFETIDCCSVSQTQMVNLVLAEAGRIPDLTDTERSSLSALTKGRWVRAQGRCPPRDEDAYSTTENGYDSGYANGGGVPWAIPEEVPETEFKIAGIPWWGLLAIAGVVLPAIFGRRR